jgi:ubiquinone/menaquinone biosynthesis C-methylase UbiE
VSVISYLDHAAASDHGRRYKERLLALLGVGEGDTALDIGCGPGTDLGPLVDAVGPTGRVIGIDREPAMLAEVRRRFAEVSTVDIRDGDAAALPVEDASIDRARIDRVLQHVDDPARVLTDIARVLHPGGRVALADPDWDTLAIDDVDLETSRAYTRHVSTRVVRNAAMGRQLARLAHDAGLAVPVVRAESMTFTDHAAADRILRFATVVEGGIAGGHLDPIAARAWLERIAQAPTFVAGFTFYMVIAERL